MARKKMSNATKLKISNEKHWGLAWKHNGAYLNSTNIKDREKERVVFCYHVEVRDTQMLENRILSKAEKRAIYEATARKVRGKPHFPLSAKENSPKRYPQGSP